MESKVSENKESRPLRRSTRQSSGNVKVLSVEPTPRGPLKRTRRRVENQAPAPAAAVNGSKDVENDSEDEESPSKKSRLEARGSVGDSGDDNDTEMDVQESAEDVEEDEDQEMDTTQDPSHATNQPEIFKGARGDGSLSPRVIIRPVDDRTVHEAADLLKNKRVKPSTKGPVAPPKSVTHTIPEVSRHDALKFPIKDDYWKPMEPKANSAGTPKFNYRAPSVYSASEISYTTRQRVNNIPKQKETTQPRKQGTKKTAEIKRSTGYSCRGFMWSLCRFTLVVLLCLAALLAYKTKKTADGAKHPSRAVKPEIFADQFPPLEAQFPSQRPDLWKRSKIHLEKHLSTAEPTEPVSLILTAGCRGERTLHCLAQSLASAFSSAHNGSVFHIDGAGKASQDSDQVKLDVDSQLQAAFEGDKPTAVIHRFEELPPGSTLIFYRYCDHETAAYKRVFLLFTVLLPQDEVSHELSLKAVEEMVYDYVKQKLVDSSSHTGFNEMDIDKFGGLWSRISHLVLPVVSEVDIEQKGC